MPTGTTRSADAAVGTPATAICKYGGRAPSPAPPAPSSAYPSPLRRLHRSRRRRQQSRRRRL
eukprot:scaffold111801_cov57-Phaeocystis_antarctica.AAC.1